MDALSDDDDYVCREPQISSLVATRGEAAAGGAAVQRVGAAVCCAVERFVAVGETIADDNPDVRHSMVLACKEARAAALPQHQRIAGGGTVSISQYPFSAALLSSPTNSAFQQYCGGIIINNRSVLSAAQCWISRYANHRRIRVGSANSNSGGRLYTIAQLIAHPHYNVWTHDNDIGIVRASSRFSFGTNVRAGSIAGPNYVLPDNQYVWATGWGQTFAGGMSSAQLRHVELRTVNQVRCQNTYPRYITPNMLCAGWDAGGRGSCYGDYGSPLLHNHVAVGVTSFLYDCGDARFPSVYARVSRFTYWIQANA